MDWKTKASIRILFTWFLIGISCNIKGQADDICGYWRTLKGNAQIEVFKGSDGKYAGRIIWLRIEKDRPDLNNNDKSLRNRKILGLKILEDLKYDSHNQRWKDGKIYDPETGNIYQCSVTLEHSKEILVLKGYLPGFKIISRESRWVREYKLRQ